MWLVTFAFNILSSDLAAVSFASILLRPAQQSFDVNIYMMMIIIIIISQVIGTLCMLTWLRITSVKYVLFNKSYHL
jgi:hypothetical protein